jgi:hypothetical protein
LKELLPIIFKAKKNISQQAIILLKNSCFGGSFCCLNYPTKYPAPVFKQNTDELYLYFRIFLKKNARFDLKKSGFFIWQIVCLPAGGVRNVMTNKNWIFFFV